MTDQRGSDTMYSVRPCPRCGDSMVRMTAVEHRRSWRCPSCGKTSR